MKTAIICIRHGRDLDPYVTYHVLDGDHTGLIDHHDILAYELLRNAEAGSLPDFATAIREGAHLIEVYIDVGD